MQMMFDWRFSDHHGSRGIIGWVVALLLEGNFET
jgi:hypothetical protein